MLALPVVGYIGTVCRRQFRAAGKPSLASLARLLSVSIYLSVKASIFRRRLERLSGRLIDVST